MPIIRAFCEDDIDATARLHQAVFPPDEEPASLAAYRAYFRDTFLSGPRPESGFPSLVCEEPDGALSGFLGVIPVRMAVGGEPIWATVCTQFCVDPRLRGMRGLQLIRRHFDGPQDLSITDEANAISRRLWAWAGGEALTSFSLWFLRPLRPTRFATALAARRSALSGLAGPMALPARVVDAALARIPRSHFHQSPPTTQGEPLDAAGLIDALPEVARERRLVPLYEPASLGWYLRRAAAALDGDLECVLVRDEDDKLLGWYIYHRGREHTAELLQLAAPEEAAQRVLDHLIYDAWQAGNTVLSGRLDLAIAQAYSDRYCLFSRRGPWTLAHARDRSILNAFHRGEAFFSRLEGEFCARFRPAS